MNSIITCKNVQSLGLLTQATIADRLEKREDVTSLKLPVPLREKIVHDNMTPPHEKLCNRWLLSKPRTDALYVWTPARKYDTIEDISFRGHFDPDKSDASEEIPRRSYRDRLRELLHERNSDTGRFIVVDDVWDSRHRWDAIERHFSTHYYGRSSNGGRYDIRDVDFVFITDRPPEIVFGCDADILKKLFVVFIDEDWSFHKQPSLSSDGLLDRWFRHPTKALFYWSPLDGPELRYADISRRIPEKSEISYNTVSLNPFRAYRESCRFIVVHYFCWIKHEEHLICSITKQYREIDFRGRRCTFKVGAELIFISQLPPEKYFEQFPGFMEECFIVRKI